MVRTSRALAVVIVLASVAASPVRAAQLSDPEAIIVKELVVTARATGPAWWRVSKGDSVVWVLGVLPGLPKGAKWDARVLNQHLAEAHQVIFPAISTAGLFDIPAMLGLRAKMKSRTPLEDQLPPDLRARFAAAVQVLNQKPSRYDRWNGAFAGLTMVGDFNRQVGLDYVALMPSIVRAARAHGLKPKVAAIYKGIGFLKAGANELNEAIEQECLSEALDEIEGGTERQRLAAEGWARGDVKLALTGSTGFNHCLNLLPAVAQVARRSMGDEAAAIGAALQQPGASVAVLPLRQLLAEDGVIEQLKAKGYAVRTPDQ